MGSLAQAICTVYDPFKSECLKRPMELLIYSMNYHESVNSSIHHSIYWHSIHCYNMLETITTDKQLDSQ